MFNIKNLFKQNKVFPKNFQNFKFYNFTDLVGSSGKTLQTGLSTVDNFNDLILKNSSHTKEEIMLSQKLGIDLYLNSHKLSVIENSGFYFIDQENQLNLSVNSQEGWRLKYLKNMNLLQIYDDIFREFLQNCAKLDNFGLDLNLEPRFANFIKFKLYELKRFGFNLEVNTIKIRQNYKILRMEIYKNLSIDRSQNSEFSKYKFNKINLGLAPMVVANEVGVDNSLAMNKKPFILATTMLIQSPMRLAIFNQNLSKEFKIKDKEVLDYVVRFETEMNYSDFGWILPSQNKPSRMNVTKITDFNNVLRGNPYFTEKIDLDDENLRYTYMLKDSRLDSEAVSMLKTLNMSS